MYTACTPSDVQCVILYSLSSIPVRIVQTKKQHCTSRQPRGTNFGSHATDSSLMHESLARTP